MSINSLTETEVRSAFLANNAGNVVLGGNAPAAGPAAGPAAPPAAPPAPPNTVTNALSMLVKYIPTESVTLYVAALAAITAIKSFWPDITGAHVYWFFAALTPVIFILVLLGKRKALRLPAVPPAKQWPWWKLIASTVAFLVWGLAVPGNPDLIKGDTGGPLVGFFAIFISTILSLLDPIFDRQPEV